jgi:voltage-gated potassium channel Kch
MHEDATAPVTPATDPATARAGPLDDLGEATPGPPNAWLGVVRAPWWRRHRLKVLPLVILGTIALGWWGFQELHAESNNWLQDLYHSVKLYTLDLGPAGGSEGVGTNWQVLLAFVLAAVLVIRAVLALGGSRIRRYATGHWLSEHVIICGAGVHGTQLAEELSPHHDVVVVDLDGQAPGMQAPPRRHEWRLVADALQPKTLLDAGLRRAKWLLLVTGNDFANSQIVSAVNHLCEAPKTTPPKGIQLLVQIEDPSLARFLEEGESASTSTPTVSVFSANAVVAGALFGEGVSPDDQSRERSQDDVARLVELDHHRQPHLLLAGDHPLLEAIVLAALRRRRAQRERGLELQRGGGNDELPPCLRVSVIGPGAQALASALRERWLPELEVLEVEGQDMELGDERAVLTNQWLRHRRTPVHALVACNEELDGVGLTLAVSRALGDGIPLTRVTTQPESELDRHLERQTKHSRYLATTSVQAIADLAWKRDGIRRIFRTVRLTQALGETSRATKNTALPAGDALEYANALFEKLQIHSDPAPRVTPGNWPLVNAMLQSALPDGKASQPVTVSAFMGAGLVADLESGGNLQKAAKELAERRETDAAFAAWCEYYRRAGGVDTDVLNRLFGQSEDRPDLPDTGPLATAERIVVFLAAAGEVRSEALVEFSNLVSRAFLGVEGAILLPEAESELLGTVATARLPAELAVFDYSHQGGQFGLWSDVLRSGREIGDVRVIGLSGTEIPANELLLARALGARVVWMNPTDEQRPVALDEALPLGAEEILEIPSDPMTLRAFVVAAARTPPGPPVQALPKLARSLQESYGINQRDRKNADDPALAPYERLLPTFQQSVTAQAQDIPNKLALVGKATVGPSENGTRPGEPLYLEPAQIELLAEVEHGRYNHERLNAGWTLGPRQVNRLITPFLVPWSRLAEEYREWDREAVRAIEPALRAAGLGVTGRAASRSAVTPEADVV